MIILKTLIGCLYVKYLKIYKKIDLNMFPFTPDLIFYLVKILKENSNGSENYVVLNLE